MRGSILALTIFLLCSLVKSADIDSKYLRCLVCRATINELEADLGKIDPSIEIGVGNYRMDAKGNTIQKRIPVVRSEVHISDRLDAVCDKMSDYVRATYKSNGQLTILNLLSPSGAMNSEISKVDLIQDGDLNKSLKYYCEGIVEEFEDSIISLLSKGETNIKGKVCIDVAKLCNSEDFINEDDTDSESDDINFIEDDRREMYDEL